MLATGCATTGGETDTFCITHSPTYFTSAEIDAMSDGTARKVLADNEYGAKHCGWRKAKHK